MKQRLRLHENLKGIPPNLLLRVGSTHNGVHEGRTQLGAQSYLLKLVGLIFAINGSQFGWRRLSHQLCNLLCNGTQMLGRVAGIVHQCGCPVLVIESRCCPGIAIQQV